MSINLFELFQNGMPTKGEGLDHEKLEKLKGYEFNVLDLQNSAKSELLALKTLAKKQEMQTISLQTQQDYRWFLTQIAQGKHPYQVFLNRLIDGITPTSIPLAAYKDLLECWDQKGGSSKAIEVFSKETKTNEWIKEKTPSPSEEKINGYLVTLSKTLNNVENLFGLIPLIVRRDDPELMIAYMKWCLQQGKTPEEIIKSGLLQLFFISHLDLQSPESTFGRMYALMRQDNDLIDTYKLADNERSASLKGMSKGLLRGFNKALTGTQLTIEYSPPGFSNCNNPTLSLTAAHDPKAYLELLGLSYAMELMRAYPRYGTKLTSVLSLLSVQDLIECLAEVGPLLSEAALNEISQFITIDKIPSLIEKRNWIAFRFISNPVVVSFFESKTLDERREFIKVTKTQHDIDAFLLTIKLFNTNLVEDQDKKEIYQAVLDGVLNQRIEDPKLINFLISNKRLCKEEIDKKNQWFNQQLTDLEKSILQTGLTLDSSNALVDCWSRCLPSYNLLKGLNLTTIEPNFPANKYELWIRIIKLQQTTLQAEFDLESTLKLLFQGRNLSDLTSNEKSELQRLLAEFVVSIDDPNCQQGMITQIDRLITSNQLESIWASEALVLAAKVSRIALIEKLIERDQLTQQKITEAFILLVEGGGGEVGLVKKFLNLPENIQPSHQAVEKSFQLAIKCPTNLIASALLLHKGDNQLSQQTVINYLFAIVQKKTEASLEILDTLLNMNGDNKPDTESLGKALVQAAASGNSTGIKMILTMKQASIPKMDLNFIPSPEDLGLCLTNLLKPEMIEDVIMILNKKQPIDQSSLQLCNRWAMINKNLDIITELLNITGDYQLKKHEVVKTLTWACMNNELEIINQILDLNGSNKLDKAELDIQVERELNKNQPNQEILKALLGVKAGEKSFETPLNAKIDTSELDQLVKNMPWKEHILLRFVPDTMLKIKKMLDAGCSPKLVGRYLLRKNDEFEHFTKYFQEHEPYLKSELINIVNCLTKLGIPKTDMAWSSKMTEPPKNTFLASSMNFFNISSKNTNLSNNSHNLLSKSPKK